MLNIASRADGNSHTAGSSSLKWPLLCSIKICAPNFSSNIAKTLVTIFDRNLFNNSLIIADELRKKNIATILYPVIDDKIDKQLKYANKKNIPYVVIIGPEEVASGKIVLKDMKTGEQFKLSKDELVSKLC